MRCEPCTLLQRIFLLVIAVVLIGTFSAFAETVQGDLEARFADEPSLDYEGNTYRLRRRLTTVLIAGTDMGAGSQGYALGARNGGQADFLLLLVVDDEEKRITPVQINRDTMTEITILNVMGDVSGTREAQICLAHSFGDGGETSCELLTSAVSNYLKDTPVDHYFVMQLDGISALNDALGGVEVTLEDDFSAFDPEMTPGKTLILTGEQAEIFLRQRYTVGDQTNISRQSRQQTYIRAAVDQVIEKIRKRSGFINTLIDTVGENAVTNMSRGRLMNIASVAQKYEIAAVRTVDGETRIGTDGFVQFITDESSLMQLLIDVFYKIEE